MPSPQVVAPEPARQSEIPGENTVSSSLESILKSSQMVIGKRLELALIEARQAFARSLEGAACTAAAVILGTGAWFAGAAALVMALLPHSRPTTLLAAFALVHTAGALACMMVARRLQLPAQSQVFDGALEQPAQESFR